MADAVDATPELAGAFDFASWCIPEQDNCTGRKREGLRAHLERFYGRRRPEEMKLRAAAEGTLARDPTAKIGRIGAIWMRKEKYGVGRELYRASGKQIGKESRVSRVDFAPGRVPPGLGERKEMR